MCRRASGMPGRARAPRSREALRRASPRVPRWFLRARRRERAPPATVGGNAAAVVARFVAPPFDVAQGVEPVEPRAPGIVSRPTTARLGMDSAADGADNGRTQREPAREGQSCTSTTSSFARRSVACWLPPPSGASAASSSATWLESSKPTCGANTRRRRSNATSDRLSPAVTTLVAYLAGERPLAELPIDVPGTPFQRRVWKQLQRIPVGRTSSYGDVAKAIGQPEAARAVASACASNHVALAIPCHRVLQVDGDLGGYRWGALRKARLLAIEQEMPTPARPATKRAARRA